MEKNLILKCLYSIPPLKSNKFLLNMFDFYQLFLLFLTIEFIKLIQCWLFLIIFPFFLRIPNIFDPFKQYYLTNNSHWNEERLKNLKMHEMGSFVCQEVVWILQADQVKYQESKNLMYFCFRKILLDENLLHFWLHFLQDLIFPLILR